MSLITAVKGTVRDVTLSVIPNAPVRLTSDIAPTQESNTDVEGKYSFSGLRAGTYSVSVSVAGFDSFQSTQFHVAQGQIIEQDVTLTPAGTKTVTEVTSSAPQVETADPSVFNTISSKEVVGLQLNGRNFIQLIALTPGVSNQTGQDEASVGVQGSAAYSVNGGRTEYNTFDLDGSDLLNVGFNGSINTLIVYPSLDAIGELKILTSNYGAMYGRTASGTVLVSTKSGTNQFHGNGYYFIRNEAFNARNFFDATKGAPLYRRHDPGRDYRRSFLHTRRLQQSQGSDFLLLFRRVSQGENTLRIQPGRTVAGRKGREFRRRLPGWRRSSIVPSVRLPELPVVPRI